MVYINFQRKKNFQENYQTYRHYPFKLQYVNSVNHKQITAKG